MYPILFRWGPFALHTYGLFAALGFLAAYGLADRIARKKGLPPALIGDALAPLLIGGIVGARTFYVIFHWTEFSGLWLDTVKIWQGGLMWQGGFLGGVSALVFYARRKKVSFTSLADALAPAVALGQAVGRVGCLFAGCCYGKACGLPWAITFHNAESLAPTGQALHPTQLYDAGLDLVIAAVLLSIQVGGPRARKKLHPGQISALYLIFAGAARLTVEPFRADARGAGWGIFSATGLVAVGILIAGLILLFALRRRATQ